MVGDIDTLNSKHLMCLVEECVKIPHVTDEYLIAFIRYNLEVMQSGVFPSVGFRGQKLDKDRQKLAGLPLAGGWRAAFFGCQADTKEKVKQNRFMRNWQASFICERCLASRLVESGNPYDFREGSNWMKLLVDHDLYIRSTPPESLSPWVAIPGWRLDRVLDDLLHNMWLGWTKDLVGQVLYERALDYDTVEGGLKALTLDCKRWCREKKSIYPCRSLLLWRPLV